MRIQMSKCPNHNAANSTYLSMNSFNNNNLMIQNGNDETNIETTDNLLLQSTTNASQQRVGWNLPNTRNGNGKRTSLSWHVRICTNNNINCGARGDLSINLNGNKVANQITEEVDDNDKNNCPTSPFECEARYRKTWI